MPKQPYKHLSYRNIAEFRLSGLNRSDSRQFEKIFEFFLNMHHGVHIRIITVERSAPDSLWPLSCPISGVLNYFYNNAARCRESGTQETLLFPRDLVVPSTYGIDVNSFSQSLLMSLMGSGQDVHMEE